MNIEISNQDSKATVFDKIRNEIEKYNFNIINEDQTRPWGGFFVIDETQASDFIAKFFSHLKLDDVKITNKLSPKILVVAPNSRLSWQYHFRRSEIWKVVTGPVGVKISDTDVEGELKTLDNGDFIQMDKGERHRLIGLDSWGVIAEIWQHTDENNPSDEDDIVRLQDDFGR
ncbi:cupin domain-containing protein [Flavobacterium hydrophilum]|uniref:Phosphoheptose isomerase n=1 Tax=Flavobacterium hydrophilum TaxID=2211445 RepID=A0A2V4BZP2_9FLAO|nr:phosphoheptose isomerase [Flavobacterium hydrophilum]PXY43120.1 phosphoheptose isomerase [Flavobacterium hydrophilum]